MTPPALRPPPIGPRRAPDEGPRKVEVAVSVNGGKPELWYREFAMGAISPEKLFAKLNFVGGDLLLDGNSGDRIVLTITVEIP